MRAEFNAVKRLLEKGLRKTALNKIWQRICDEYEVGHIAGKTVHFTLEDINYLRDVIILETGYDPLGESIEGDRIEVAKSATNEKLSNQSVFGSLIQVARFNNMPIPIHGTNVKACTPQGSVLSIHPEKFLLDEIPSIIVVENGTAMTHWEKFQYPESLQESLIIYRGHKENARWVSTIVEKATRIVKYGFFDCDPKGIHIAISHSFDKLLIPSNLLDLVQSETFAQINKKNSYYDQLDSMKGLLHQTSDPCASFTEDFRCLIKVVEQHKVALMQEHLSAHSIPLIAIQIRT